MKDICIPLPHLLEKELREVEITIKGKKRKYNFRVESFPWRGSNSESIPMKESVEQLRGQIQHYDSGWELIQIFNPAENDDFVQVLFRQKSQQNDDC